MSAVHAIDAATVFEFLVVFGFASLVQSIARRIVFRKKDNRDSVVAAATALYEPLEKRLAAADKKVDELVVKLDEAIKRAELAEAVLTSHNIPIPIRRVQ